MADLNWTLKTEVAQGSIVEFTDRADLSFTSKLGISVPALGKVSYEFASGWTKYIMLFVLDPGEPDGDLLWGFDSQALAPADSVIVCAGTAACDALLGLRKAVHFKNNSNIQKEVVIFLGHRKEGLKQPENVDDAYVVPSIRVEVQPTPEFVIYPEIAIHMRSVGSVHTTLPKNGCLTVPIVPVDGNAGFGVFVISVSQYIEGLSYSIDGGKTWKPITQASVAFGIDACSYLPEDLSAVQFQNEGVEDVGLSFVAAQWVPPFVPK